MTLHIPSIHTDPSTRRFTLSVDSSQEVQAVTEGASPPFELPDLYRPLSCHGQGSGPSFSTGVGEPSAPGCNTRPVGPPQQNGTSGLEQRVASAEVRVAWQDRLELYEAMDDEEIAAEQDRHRRMRRLVRAERTREFRAEMRARRRARRGTIRLQHDQERQNRWHARARAAQDRFSSRDAQLALVHRQATRSSMRLRAVLVVGLCWSAVNVGRNLTPDHGAEDLTWWLFWVLSFAIEAMISVPILEVMAHASTAARLGRKVDRTRIALFEAALLTGTIGLNSGLHLASGDYGRAAEYSVAPIMVVVLMWLHSWLANRNAELLNHLTASESDKEAAFTDLSGAAQSWHHSRSDDDQKSALGTEGAAVQAATAAYTPDPRLNDSPHGGASVHADPAAIAHQLVALRRTEKSVEEVMRILELAASGMNAQSIASEMTRRQDATWPRSTVDRILGRAAELGFPHCHRRRGATQPQATPTHATPV